MAVTMAEIERKAKTATREAFRSAYQRQLKGLLAGQFQHHHHQQHQHQQEEQRMQGLLEQEQRKQEQQQWQRRRQQQRRQWQEQEREQQRQEWQQLWHKWQEQRQQRQERERQRQELVNSFQRLFTLSEGGPRAAEAALTAAASATAASASHTAVASAPSASSSASAAASTSGALATTASAAFSLAGTSATLTDQASSTEVARSWQAGAGASSLGAHPPQVAGARNGSTDGRAQNDLDRTASFGKWLSDHQPSDGASGWGSSMGDACPQAGKRQKRANVSDSALVLQARPGVLVRVSESPEFDVPAAPSSSWRVQNVSTHSPNRLVLFGKTLEVVISP